MKNIYKIEDELYIISDKEKSSYCIKECPMAGLKIDRCDCPIQGGCSTKVGTIILTTNKLLIKDGVQAIDDEFLEWFVKNPSCEEVEITRPNKCKIVGCDLECILFKTCENIYIVYEIIIPKEDLGYTTKMDVEVSDEMVRATMIPKDRIDELLESLSKKHLTVEDLKINQYVYHTDIYWSREQMKIVGLREDEVELEGDYSGGTNNTIGRQWFPIKGVSLIKSGVEGGEWRNSK